MTDFTMEKGADGVAVITWDTEGKSMNVMTMEAWPVLDGLIDDALADDAVKGIVITSGKDSTFAGGMDLNVISKMKDMAGDEPAKGLFDGLMNMHGILRKIDGGATVEPKRRGTGGTMLEILQETTHVDGLAPSRGSHLSKA